MTSHYFEKMSSNIAHELIKKIWKHQTFNLKPDGMATVERRKVELWEYKIFTTLFPHRDLSTFDLYHIHFPLMKDIEIVVDIDYCWDEQQVKEFFQSSLDIPNYVSATIFVMRKPQYFICGFNVHFWNTCFLEQKEWMERYLIRQIRKEIKDLNWELRKHFLLVVHDNVACDPKKHVRQVEQVFHNKDLVRLIATFI